MAHEEQDSVDGWQTYSNWLDILRNDNKILEKYEHDDTFKLNLTSCQTNFERFQLIWNNQELRNEIGRLYTQDSQRLKNVREFDNYSKKCLTLSKRMRELGNKSFKKGSYREALKHYTQAVQFAPYPNLSNSSQISQDDTLALAFANRSAALYALSRFRLCLMDIDLASKYGFPEANKFKLSIRKVKCLHILSVWTNDVEQIKQDLRSMMDKTSTPEYIKTEISNMFEFLNQTQPENMEKDDSDAEDESAIKISNVSKLLPQAADCVEMSYDPEKGRYLLTNKDVSFGRLLVAEDPYVSNLAPKKRNQHCYNCFGRLYNCGLSCHTCTQVFYCSMDCLEANKQLHSYECSSFLDFQKELGVVYLVAHILFKIEFNLTDIPIHTKKNVEMKSLDAVSNISYSNWPDLVYKNDYAAVFSLMDHASDYDYVDLLSYTLTSAYLLTAFIDLYSDRHPNSLSTSNPKTILVIGSVILKHILQLQTNLISILSQSHSSLVATGHSIGDIREQPIGVGLYPTVSLLNHSCQPNILSLFHRNRFVARASSSLECGTEINYCYGPSFNRMSKKDRQERLKDQYFFTCSCDCCANERENHSRALVCPGCQGPVIFNFDLSHRCMDCKNENVIDVKKSLDQVEVLKNDLAILRLEENNDLDKMVKLEKIEENLSKLIYWRHPMFVQVKSQLIECAEEQEDLESALKYSKEELELSNKTFGKDSLESIMTKLKYINFYWQRLYYKIEDCKSEEEKKVDMEELKTLSTSVGTTRSRLKDLLNSTSILGAESTFNTELKFLATVHSNINKYLATLEGPTNEEKESSKAE